jgi:hypothetical protein
MISAYNASSTTITSATQAQTTFTPPTKLSSTLTTQSERQKEKKNVIEHQDGTTTNPLRYQPSISSSQPALTFDTRLMTLSDVLTPINTTGSATLTDTKDEDLLGIGAFVQDMDRYDHTELVSYGRGGYQEAAAGTRNDLGYDGIRAYFYDEPSSLNRFMCDSSPWSSFARQEG